ncbi:hypothetical protein H0H81_010016 [Sphagnurus paluster]|uniref:Uncharacterized protein n=1 Tax=Sphagnurus paluster TaxID=117069 RepID=A0A9P7G1J7_9AGAR|nr:hypothetical protein H0H81_010016 [Sphagnurus paluster]
MSSDALANFACLDELTKVLYQGAYRFVVLSTVSDQWTIYLGLAGPEGRWWRGGWTKADILRIVLTFGPSSKKPLHVPLFEITSAEAASHATDVMLDIALQAQSRKCRLHPDQYTASHTPPTSSSATVNVTANTTTTTGPIAAVSHRIPTANAKQKAETSTSRSTDQKAQDEIKALKAELEKQKQQITPLQSRAKPATVANPHKGASLANPNKKARKYQAIEFESDDE